MIVSLISAAETGNGLLREWRRLQNSNPALASPFFTPEFTACVSAVRPNVEIALVEVDRRLAAIFPFERCKKVLGRPVGGILSDYQGLVCEPDLNINVSWLVKNSRLCTWDFDHLIASQGSFAPFHRRHLPSPQMDLSRGYKIYVKEQQADGSLAIKKCANLARRIAREIGPLRYVRHTENVDLLHQILAWKSQQYIATSEHDLFALAWPRELLERIHGVQGKEFAGTLSLLYAGNKLIAGHMGMRSRTVLHYWFPAYDKRFAKYSPGLILLLTMAEDANQIGLSTIDLGMGMSLYKERLMNACVTLAGGSVALPSWASLRRTARERMKLVLQRTPLWQVLRRGRTVHV